VDKTAYVTGSRFPTDLTAVVESVFPALPAMKFVTMKCLRYC